MDLGIAGRKAIVAGGSAGMGFSSAKALAREGVEIFLSARGEARLLASADALARETGARVTPVVADHSTELGRSRLLSACPAPDIMVITCAPPRITEDYRDIAGDEWREAMETTFIGPVELMKMALDGMVDRGFGRIVNIGTGAAKAPAMIRMLSGPARSALLNYTVALSKHLCTRNVIINNILPGMFHTATIAERFGAWAAENGTTYEEETQKFVAKWNIPAGRFGDPDDLGAFVAMFCSRQANYVVGQSLVIDG
jgi:3-oxoacyl-[acyl-carrier protein] reductase